LAWLGPEAQWTGQVWPQWRKGKPEIILAGQFTQVDLASLTRDLAREGLSGTALMRLDRARLADGRIEEAAGRLTASRGEVSTALLTAFKRCLQCPLADGVERLDVPLRYEQLAMDFALDERGVALRGRAEGNLPGAMLVGEFSTLLGEPAEAVQPLANLVRALAGEGATNLPATREAQRLARTLPLPGAKRPLPEPAHTADRRKK
jgi:hypothetical protein